LTVWDLALPLSVSASYLSLYRVRICLDPGLHTYPRIPSPRMPYPAVSPHRSPRPAGPDAPVFTGAHSRLDRRGRRETGTGISTCRPSTTPYGLALGPDLPWADEPCPGTLGHSAEGFLPPHSLLMPAFALQPRPRLSSPAASPADGRSPTQHPPISGPTLQAG
jgi:hypothetical protein